MFLHCYPLEGNFHCKNTRFYEREVRCLLFFTIVNFVNDALASKNKGFYAPSLGGGASPQDPSDNNNNNNNTNKNNNNNNYNNNNNDNNTNNNTNGVPFTGRCSRYSKHQQQQHQHQLQHGTELAPQLLAETTKLSFFRLGL